MSLTLAQAGPAHVDVGADEGVQSAVRLPEGITYLLVTLKPGETWTHGRRWDPRGAFRNGRH